MGLLNWLFGTEKIEPEVITEAVPEVTPEADPENDPDAMACHYCGKSFKVTAKMIFPTSVRIIYKDQFVTGKGVTCPHCFKDCIFG